MTMTPTAPIGAETTPLTLTVSSAVAIDAAVPQALRLAIVQALRLPNPAYDEAEANGRSTADLDPYLYYARHGDDSRLIVPRGAQQIVRGLCAEHDIAFVFVDGTHEAESVVFDERVTLSEAQEHAVGAALARRIGVLEAPAGAGKTVMGLVAVARRRQPALWITHTKELARQAVERAGLVLDLRPDEVGFVGDGQCRIGERLTVALVQTLARGIPPALRRVGHVIVDEAHHTPAESMAAVVAQIPARYVLGLTATPYRRDKLDRVITWYLGPIVARIAKEDLVDRLVTPRVVKRDTGIAPRGDSFTALVSQLVRTPERNRLICTDVAAAVAVGRRCLVLSDRVDHDELLADKLIEEGITAAALHGGLGKRQRAAVVEAMNAGDLAVVVATGSLVGEGLDVPRTDWLALATPVSYGGRVVQYIGRVSRTAPGKDDAIVVDYCDDHGMCWSAWKNRRRVYEHQGCAISSSPAAPTAQRRIA